MDRRTDLLIIGAGPFGLSMAALAKDLGIDFVMLGEEMGFWKTHMPKGMYLRSACDWHLDPLNVDTIDSYLRTLDLTPSDVEPLSIDFYLDYARWFLHRKELAGEPRRVQRLDLKQGHGHPFRATLDDDTVLAARSVVVALGFRYFKNLPPELVELLPEGRWSHTCDCVDFERLRDRRCLIVGGRQSAFEWAALLTEADARAVYLCHRHPSPAFEEADWSWVNPLVDAMVEDPGWFRNLSPAEKEEINHRLWAEGRLKVEPWLEPRIDRRIVHLRAGTRVVACDLRAGGDMAIRLDNGEMLEVDDVILATGYKVNIDQVPFLAGGNVLSHLETADGFPVLDEQLQTNLPGLFITSMPATQDFGPFFAFTIAVRTSAKLIGRAIEASLESIRNAESGAEAYR